MKKKWIKIICGVLIAGFIIAAVVFFIPKRTGSFNIQSVCGYFTAKSYLDNIIAEKYDKAIANVYLYEGDLSQKSGKSEADALVGWQSRIAQARAQLDYIGAYTNLKVYLKDGVLVGTVTLTEYVSGVQQICETELVFKDGKIADITAASVKDDLERNVSGNIE